MKHKPIDLRKIIFCAILTLCLDTSEAVPVDYSDLDSLLPPIPRDKNETMAAVVQDPVIMDAVHYAASNGSLNGLVVKKKVYIMPASDPNKVVSQREQLLIIPPEHLEDIRRNITETKEAELDEYSSAENQSSFEADVEEYTTERNESEPQSKSNEVGLFFEESSKSAADGVDSKLEFLEDSFTRSTLTEDANKISVPIVAIVDPSDVDGNKVDSPVIAILPNRVDDEILKDQVDYLKNNRKKIQQEAQTYIDETSLTVDPGNWKNSEFSVSSSNQDVVMSTLQNKEVPSVVSEELYLSPVILPRLEILPVFERTNSAVYPRAVNDMDVAEDIIFRPLFRYRQEAQQRSRYREEENRRRFDSRYSQNYDSYPRRRYRPRYDDYYS